MSLAEPSAGKAKSGISGLDDILSGGFSRGHVFLLEGAPGTGKTTVALQFLLEGARAGEKCLYITLSETERELREGAASHGWKLEDNIEVFELLPPESLLDTEQQQSLLYSSDLELGEATRQVFDAVERSQPDRVVLDSLSEIRLLAQSSLRYRRQILALKHILRIRRHRLAAGRPDRGNRPTRPCTASPMGWYGSKNWRRPMAPSAGACASLNIAASRFRGGYHDVTITTGGLNVFPRLVASEYRTDAVRSQMSSGIAELDKLLGGGIEAGSGTLILGRPAPANL